MGALFDEASQATAVVHMKLELTKRFLAQDAVVHSTLHTFSSEWEILEHHTRQLPENPRVHVVLCRVTTLAMAHSCSRIVIGVVGINHLQKRIFK